jgi:thymidylate synthase ThyX
MTTQATQKISAKVIADSINHNGDRMTTMEIEYPRFILAELNTHRMLSKNSASSRAIPVKAMHEQIKASPAEPVYWGKNQAGMQAKEELTGTDITDAKFIWQRAMQDALHWAWALADRVGLHKQIANRITEPWMTMKTVISGTEWNNLWWLRCHPDAQPEFRELALKMQAAYEDSEPQLLNPGEWHVPYVTTYRSIINNELLYSDGKTCEITAEQARIISASCCAQVSYRKNDDTLEKAEKIYKQLIESQPAHASPVEHQATPMLLPTYMNYEPETWEPGVTHVAANGSMWSGNLQGWIQHRKLIANEAAW